MSELERAAPFARERLTVSNAVKTLTSSVYNVEGTVGALKARRASISVEAADVRYTNQGTDPVATTTGRLLPTGSILWLNSPQAIATWKGIREGSVDATIEVEYYR